MSKKNTTTELPVIQMEDVLNKHLSKMKLDSTQREVLKASMQEVWYDEFFGGSFIELPEGMVIRFDENRLNDKEQNVLYRKLMEEECYENTETLERFAFGKVRSVSLHDLVDKIMPVYHEKMLNIEKHKRMAQA